MTVEVGAPVKRIMNITTASSKVISTTAQMLGRWLDEDSGGEGVKRVGQG